MNRLAAILLVLLIATAATAVAEVSTVRIVYVDRAGDPFYSRRESYGGIYDATRQPAFAGAELGVKDARIVGRAIGVTFELVRETISGTDSVIQTLQRNKPAAVILDLPEADVAIAAATVTGATPMFNIRQRADGLRQTTCRTNLLHVIPSDAMLNDALAQYLLLMGWTNILVLTSEAPADLAQSQSFQSSARKFGVTVSRVQQFAHGNDPRQRDMNNVRLLTGGADYDAIFVADGTGEFARSLAYRTVRPRPILGAAGLMPVAWHPQWERHGAPQLNRRFFKLAGRTMTEEDWAAWVAVKAVVEAEVRKRKGDQGSLIDILLRPDIGLELYKGFPGSFRPWDHQLRQSVLLATADTVIALAPVEGALHQFNNLDTLGFDAPEFHCP